jgi:hypothetical protein
MHRIFSANFLTKNEINCLKCSWKGKVKKAEQEELFLTGAVELYCPACHQYIGLADINEDKDGSIKSDF